MSYLQSFFSTLLIFFCVVLNQSALSNLLITVVLLSLFLVNLKEYGFIQKRPSVYILFFSFLLSGIIGVMTDEGSKSLFRCLGLLILVVSFPLHYKWNNRHFYLLLFMSGVYLLVLQLGQVFGIDQTENFITHYYPIENNLWNEEATSIRNINEYTQEGSRIRYGGIFYNPNIMGQMIAFWYIIMRNFSQKNRPLTLLIFLVALISILFSGSRTAFIVFAVYNSILYWNVFRRYSFILILAVISFFFFSLFKINSFDGLRIFNITQAVTSREGSVNFKYDIFKRWLDDQTIPSNFDLTKFLFGNLSWDVEFDNDPGYILNFFGFAGALFLLYFLFDTYKHSTRLGKLNFCLLLIGLGATVIMNFRFSILLFLVLSIGYNHLSIQKLKS